MKEAFVGIGSLLIILFLLILGLRSCSYHVTGTGERSGTIIKVSNDGLIFKTHEAEMIKGGLNGGNGGFGVNPFFFTIRDLPLLQRLNQSFENGKEITITYHTELFCPFDSETGALTESNQPCTYLDSIK